VPKIDALAMQDRHSKVYSIAQECSVSEPPVLVILHDHLSMSEVISHWVQTMLIPFQKHWKFQISDRNFRPYEAYPQTFFSRIVTSEGNMDPSLESRNKTEVHAMENIIVHHSQVLNTLLAVKSMLMMF
jgi:hypothetical protein